jgi:hypothetical protein
MDDLNISFADRETMKGHQDAGTFSLTQEA